MEPQKSLIFERQLCLIDHKTWRGSSNFILMTLSIQLTFFGEMFVTISWNKSIIFHSGIENVLLTIFGAKVYRQFFLILYLALPPPLTLGNYWGSSLTNPMSIMACYLCFMQRLSGALCQDWVPRPDWSPSIVWARTLLVMISLQQPNPLNHSLYATLMNKKFNRLSWKFKRLLTIWQNTSY